MMNNIRELGSPFHHIGSADEASLSLARSSERFNAGQRGPFSSGTEGLSRTAAPHDQTQQFTQPRRVVPKGIFEGFLKTCLRWRLGLEDQITLLGYKGQDFLGEQMLSGYLPPRTQDVRDRIGLIMAISLGLGSLFNENEEAERDWLNANHPKLNSQTPRSHMLEGHLRNLMAVADIVRFERAL